jgi:hypothetical protein
LLFPGARGGYLNLHEWWRDVRDGNTGKLAEVALAPHLDGAFASLDDLTMRELAATAEALERRRDALGNFSSVFRNVAYSREDDSDLHLARFLFARPSSTAAMSLPNRSPAPRRLFWGHVRDAVALVSGDD